MKKSIFLIAAILPGFAGAATMNIWPGIAEGLRSMGFSDEVEVVKWEVPDTEPMFAVEKTDGSGVAFFRAGEAQCLDKMAGPVLCDQPAMMVVPNESETTFPVHYGPGVVKPYSPVVAFPQPPIWINTPPVIIVPPWNPPPVIVTPPPVEPPAPVDLPASFWLIFTACCILIGLHVVKTQKENW